MSPAGSAGDMFYNEAYNVFQFCSGANWIAIGQLNPGAGSGTCTGPVGAEGDMMYNADYSVMQFCNGEDWTAMGQGYCTACMGGGTVACTIGDPVGSGICGGQIYGKDIIVAPTGCAVGANDASDCTGADLSRYYIDDGNVAVSNDADLSDGIVATDKLLAGTTSSIAHYCRSLILDGKTWHVPSVADLVIIYRNKDTGAWTNGAFASTIYWTANEIEDASAWTIDFNSIPTSYVFFYDNASWVNHKIRCVTYNEPGAFTFLDQTDVALSTLTESNIVQITGISGSVATSISGGSSPEYRICSDGTSDANCDGSEVQTWTSGAATIDNNQYLQLRLTSSASNSTMLSATMSVGTGSDQWDVTTIGGGNGYFVLTNGTWTGNLGGISGADAKCLTDLTTYDWMGKSSAGSLTAARVKAFICDASSCNNLMANTTYAFAKANAVGTGGASFTTDGSGRGPGNSSSWYTATTFGSATFSQYWTGRGYAGSDTLWPTTGSGTAYCTNWSSSSSGQNGSSGTNYQGGVAQTDANRWWVGDDECNTAGVRLICFVNP